MRRSIITVAVASVAFMCPTYCQDVPKRKSRVLERPDEVISTLTEATAGKMASLGKSDYIMLQTPLPAFGDRIKYLGSNEHGAYLSGDLLPASPKYWLAASEMELSRLKQQMTLGELMGFYKKSFKDPWHLVSEDFGSSVLSDSIGQVIRLTFRTTSVKDGFITFSIVVATVVPKSGDLMDSPALIHSSASVKINALGFADLSPYNF